MQLFFATGSREYLYLLLLNNVKRILCSFYYPEPYESRKLLKRNEVKMFIDSGAFSAWSQGKSINLDNYIEFIKKNHEVIDLEKIVGLDIIMGGATKATQQEYDEACKKGFDNYYYLKEKLQSQFGKHVDPIHTFHQGDNYVWLEKMLKECTYIGISPNNDFTDEVKSLWLYECFYIIKRSNNPNIKTHGFGVTSPEILRKFPYYSADSSSWALTSAFGSIHTPYGRILISDGESRKGINDKRLNDINYIENLPLNRKEAVKKFVESFGFSYELCKKNYKYRNIINIDYYLNLEAELTKNPPILNDRQEPFLDFMNLHKTAYEIQKKKELEG